QILRYRSNCVVPSEAGVETLRFHGRHATTKGHISTQHLRKKTPSQFSIWVSSAILLPGCPRSSSSRLPACWPTCWSASGCSHTVLRKSWPIPLKPTIGGVVACGLWCVQQYGRLKIWGFDGQIERQTFAAQFYSRTCGNKHHFPSVLPVIWYAGVR